MLYRNEMVELNKILKDKKIKHINNIEYASIDKFNADITKARRILNQNRKMKEYETKLGIKREDNADFNSLYKINIKVDKIDVENDPDIKKKKSFFYENKDTIDESDEEFLNLSKLSKDSQMNLPNYINSKLTKKEENINHDNKDINNLTNNLHTNIILDDNSPVSPIHNYLKNISRSTSHALIKNYNSNHFQYHPMNHDKPFYLGNYKNNKLKDYDNVPYRKYDNHDHSKISFDNDNIDSLDYNDNSIDRDNSDSNININHINNNIEINLNYHSKINSNNEIKINNKDNKVNKVNKFNYQGKNYFNLPDLIPVIIQDSVPNTSRNKKYFSVKGNVSSRFSETPVKERDTIYNSPLQRFNIQKIYNNDNISNKYNPPKTPKTPRKDEDKTLFLSKEFKNIFKRDRVVQLKKDYDRKIQGELNSFKDFGSFIYSKINGISKKIDELKIIHKVNDKKHNDVKVFLNNNLDNNSSIKD